MRREVKKHIIQMTEKEVHIIKKKLKGLSITNLINNIKNNKHLQQRLMEKRIGIAENKLNILIHSDSTIDTNIIEYKRVYSRRGVDERVVLRKGHDKSYDMALVVSLNNNRIITAWKNRKKDNHSTLDLNEYKEDLKILA